ncbi:transglutaminase TgpA family protein [Mesobacillus selenatarsenatis]|uniref:Transglutaminase-like enzymes, putative cysteine proteases n=1 Tax=Mesobacillus selenatarsenatis (strain DSM 18680 / JCM 14380 / FERM P-15431 / SF-1) TaxID=1321606 RepID=A0A0A8XAY6_MESS1|nr:transglutaminaseTgpA domain-containing protein [Mesobacillus selenatarsenatis]GAM16202.1 transglutaminase-like enzymes, putative cysteine proteases [Mesobacillus selenatarsenatis SF-1]
MRIDKSKKDVTFFLLYIFSFLLLWEWLRPLEELTDTGHLGVFLGFVFVSLMMSYFNMPILPSALIKVIIILYSIHFMYYEGTFFSLEWFGQLFNEVIVNSVVIINAEWTEISNVFRTLLFFTLLWLMAYLIQYWLINRKQIFVFFFMTLVYITVLDTFSPYEADAAIVRTVIAGFAVMGMLAYYRTADREVVKKNLKSAKKWMIPLVAMIVLSVGIGYAAPKADPIWPDPVPFITSYNEDSGEGSGGVKKVGYGTDDSALGGPFIGDDRVVFTAEADGRHYWRIETKDVYTGKGWVADKGTAVPVEFSPEQNIPMQPFEEEVKTEQRTSRVTPKIGYPHLVYPLGVTEVEASSGNSTLQFSLDPTTEKITSIADGQAGSIGPYSLNFNHPVYSVEKLKAAGPEELATEFAFLSKYTQVPEELPERVVELAEEITKDKVTWLEKAQAIEKYFRSNEFVYDQTLVAVPEEDQDYVDQFLFETQRGYCDNFSTSMVVMMRSVGIPARWVKGYTEGEYIDTLENGRRLYEVTNNNAHSWVEGYFPGVGWVPFEPTQGFSNNVQFEYDNKDDSQTQTGQEEEEDTTPTAPEKPELPEEQAQVDKPKVSFSEGLKSAGAFLKDNLQKIFLTLLVLAVFTAIMYRLRGRWLPVLYILLYKYKKENKYMEKAYIALLLQLERYGLKREKGQTLRDYANYVDSFFSTNEMRWLTEKYEEYLYRGDTDEEMWRNAKKYWEFMIRKVSA